MRSIQEVGKEILLNNPAKFYIFVGSEYGIKCKYLQQLCTYYGGNKVEGKSILEVLTSMKKKSLIPLPPALYIVRYDEPFISSLNEKTAKEIDSLHINGTLVCLYEGSKYNAKLDKYLGNYVVSIDAVEPKFVHKYLQSDFPGLPDRLIEVAMNCSSNYGQARNICRAMVCADAGKLSSLSEYQLHRIFNFQESGTEEQIRVGVAARNFSYLLGVLDNITDYDGVIYMCIQTMIDIDKSLDLGYAPSELKGYIGGWNREDVYCVMCNAYDTLKVNRSISNQAKNNVIALFSTICQTPVPRERLQ